MANVQASFGSTITQLAEKIRKYRDKTIGEENTKASLIEPLLDSLGWDIRDLDSVHREYRAKTRDKPVDYALKLLRLPRLFIEAKGLGENLSDRKWVSQVLGYATVAGVEWCVLTDGNEYRIYNASAPVDAEEKLFRSVCILDENEAVVCSTLNLVSRDNLEENLLDVYWKAHFVDRRVRAAIMEVVNTAHPGLIRIIRKRVPNLSAKSIAESLARLDVKIELPSLPIARSRPGKSRRVPGKAITNPRREKPSHPGRKGASVALGELIPAGILKAPLALFRKYKGRQLNATLSADGGVEFEGKSYDSCSRAADQARRTVTGRRMSTNGWTFWLYEEDGVVRELDYARQRFLSGRSVPLRLSV